MSCEHECVTHEREFINENAEDSYPHGEHAT